MNIGFMAVIIFIIFIWLIILSVLLNKYLKRIAILIKGTDKQNLTDILHSLIKNQTRSDKEIADIIKGQEEIKESALHYFQKIGLVRFNPFSDTGGEQSFVLALLNKKNSGIIISGLYARSGMRWYIKRIENGIGVEHELSAEEKKAIEIAK